MEVDFVGLFEFMGEDMGFVVRRGVLCIGFEFKNLVGCDWMIIERRFDKRLCLINYDRVIF